MKYIKPIAGWLVEARGLEELIKLGLVDLDTLTIVEFKARRYSNVGRLWKSFQGITQQPAIEAELRNLEVVDWFLKLPGTKQLPGLWSGSARLPRSLSFEELADRARNLDQAQFADWFDEFILGHFKRSSEAGVFVLNPPDLIMSLDTGRVAAVSAPKRMDEASGLDRLIELGIIDPERSERIEYVLNTYAVESSIDELEEDGPVPSRLVRKNLFFVYAYDEAGKALNAAIGDTVRGSEFLTDDSFRELEGLKGDAYNYKLEDLFVEWLKGQPDSYFMAMGFKRRPLFARDETAAILGYAEWTPLLESERSGFDQLIRLGLVDPVSQPRVEYKVRGWFPNSLEVEARHFQAPDIRERPHAHRRLLRQIWKELSGAIAGHAQMYAAGTADVSNWVSLLGRDIIDGPEGLEPLLMLQSREEIAAALEELIIKRIKLGFLTNWTTNRGIEPSTNPADEQKPTLIRRTDEPDWRRFTLTESSQPGGQLRLAQLGLVEEPTHITYEIDVPRLQTIWKELRSPDESPQWKKYLFYNTIANRFAWWYHMVTGPAAEKLFDEGYPSIDNKVLYNEGAFAIRNILEPGEVIDAGEDFEEFLEEVRAKIRRTLMELMSSERYPPQFITETDSGVWYSFDTGERIKG